MISCQQRLIIMHSMHSIYNCRLVADMLCPLILSDQLPPPHQTIIFTILGIQHTKDKRKFVNIVAPSASREKSSSTRSSEPASSCASITSRPALLEWEACRAVQVAKGTMTLCHDRSRSSAQASRMCAVDRCGVGVECAREAADRVRWADRVVGKAVSPDWRLGRGG